MEEQRQTKSGAIESKLDGVGSFYLFISILSMVICILLSQEESVKQTGLSSFWIALGIGSTAQGIIFWIVFKASAEVIRLLKKLNGISYTGDISGTVDNSVEYSCTDCGAPVTSDSKFCPNCGASFENEKEPQ